MMRVVPLFETLDDLERSSSVTETLFTLPAYRDRIDGRQEIMVGYSDSAKDAGR
jgi:phosphoenolpyruvate carboxylase